MLNKTIFQKLLKTIAAAAIVLGPIMSAQAVLAASASMSLTHSGSSVNGGTLSISIRENSGAEPVNSASATITYPTGLLSYLSTTNSTAFGIAAATSGGGGSAHVERGALPAVSGSQTIAIVNFRVLAASGTASINLTSGQVLSANSNANIASGYSGTSVTLSAPAPPTPAAPQDTTPPTITAVQTSAVSFNSVTVSWTTSEPATSEVDYGPTNGYGLGASDASLVTSHKVVLNSPLIVPSASYHYRVKSADAAGNAAASPDAAFTTQGGTLSITLTDQKHKPLSGAAVSLLDASAVTDKKGQAVVKNVQPGKQTLVVKYKGKTYTQSATISILDANGAAQPSKFTIKTVSSAGSIIIPLIVVILILVALAWWLRKGGGLPPNLKNRFNLKGRFTKHSPPPPTAAAAASPTPTIIKPSSSK